MDHESEIVVMETIQTEGEILILLALHIPKAIISIVLCY
jgi:hypothetical protein